MAGGITGTHGVGEPGAVADNNARDTAILALQAATTTGALAETIDDRVAALLQAGTGVTLTYNDAAGTLTIAATSTGGTTDPEVVRDTIAAALVAGTGVTIVANDAADTITISATGAATVGRPINLLDYGADNTGATDSDTAMTNALAAVPVGGVLDIPAGKYRFLNPIVIPPAITIRGAGGHRYQKYNTPGGTNSTYIKPHSGSFTGTALMMSTDSWGWHVENINLDGFAGLASGGGNIDGMLINGASKGWKLKAMSVKNFSGHGVHTDAITSGYPNGFVVWDVFLDGNSGHGWYSANTAGRNYPVGDCFFGFSESSVNGLDGWNWQGCNNFSAVDMKAEFNLGRGYHFAGSVLRTKLTSSTTDRNLYDGLWCDSPIQSGSAAANYFTLNDVHTARDGCTDASDSASPAGSSPYSGGYAGFNFTTSDGSSNSVRVVMSGCTNRVGRNDSGNGVMSPDYGIYAPRGSRILLDGSFLAGTTAPVYDPLISVRAGFAVQGITVDPNSYAVTSDVNITSIYNVWGGSTLRLTDAATPASNTLSAKAHMERTGNNVILGLVNSGAGNTTPMVSAQAGTATSATLGTTVAGDTFSRFMLRSNGTLEWGTGGAARDVILQRDATGVLDLTSGSLQIAGQTVTADPGFKGLRSTVPTTGTAAVGDWYRNSAPTASGTYAWVCTTAGSPGTWKVVSLGA